MTAAHRPCLCDSPRCPSYLQLEVAELCELAHPERPVSLKLVVVDQVKPQTAANLDTKSIKHQTVV
jgi:hypothetical protein